MSRFTKELRVIPEVRVDRCRVRLFVLHPAVFLFVAPTDPVVAKLPRWGQALWFTDFPVHGGLGCADRIRLRRREAAADAVRNVDAAGDLLPHAIGMILYFILRDPLPKVCTGCGNVEKARFPFCPHCGTLLQQTCSKCGQPVETTWANCAHCGQRLPGSAPRAARNPSVAT